MQLFHSYNILSNSTLKKYMDHKSEFQNVEYSILCLHKLPLELVARVAAPLWRTLISMVSLKTYLSHKLQKLQSRHIQTSRTQWGHVCETSFISLYHQDMRCQAEVPR